MWRDRLAGLLNPQVANALAEIARQILATGDPKAPLTPEDLAQLTELRRRYENVVLYEEELRSARRELRMALERIAQQLAFEDAGRDAQVDQPTKDLLGWFKRLGVP